MVIVSVCILSSGFMEHLQGNKNYDEQDNFTYCPHCGKKLK